MKRTAILLAFACICLALSTCENPQLITLLKAPSELVSLEIVAYAGDAQLEGGAAMEPGFTTSVFNYTVYVSKDTDRFLVNASINGNGTIEVMCEEDQETGTEFDFLDDEKVMILTVEREYMDVAEYRVTVIREETVPTARGVEISVTPGIGAFFLGRGVLPEFRVTAKPPSVGGELSYQWFVNTEDSNRGGTRINGATGTTYKMKSYETMITGTFYYYAEITNTLDGKTGITESLPCRVTFVDKNDLNEKSHGTMVDIPARNVSVSQWEDGYEYGVPAWSTPGFSMGKYLVTYELWKFVFDHADAANYRLSNAGNQGFQAVDVKYTSQKPGPVGTALHPVTLISWRDAIVWCNAYSEMDGLEPVYVDSDGNVLTSSRMAVEELIDETKMTGNGYRLPTPEEWRYAMRGANPLSPLWTSYGIDDAESDQYWWFANRPYGNWQTGEVGSLLPNSIGLFDIAPGSSGMGGEWLWWFATESDGAYYEGNVRLSDRNYVFPNLIVNDLVDVVRVLRLARNKE